MILLTGFEPFGGDCHNPSEVIAKACASAKVAVRILPVDGSKIEAVLTKAVLETKPKVLLMLGLARGKTRLALEKVAVNWLEYRIPDNAGAIRQGEKMLETAPEALFNTLPLEVIQHGLTTKGIPFELSFSAGAFLCNQVFFLARAKFPDLPSGFIHLPSDETLAFGQSEPFVPLEYQVKAVQVILESLTALDS
jgi:pyroglutamyl-peptidase